MEHILGVGGFGLSKSRGGDASGHLWVEEGEECAGLIAEVAPIIRSWRTYSYVVPEAMESSLKPGHRVNIPMGRGGRMVQGFVVALSHQVWDTTIRPIDSFVDDDSYLTPELIELGREIALHYACPLGRTLKAMTPEAVRLGRGLRRIRYARLVTPVKNEPEAGRRWSPQRRRLMDRLVEAQSDSSSNKDDVVPVAPLLEAADASVAVLRAMERDGLVEIITRREDVTQEAPTTPPVEPTFDLNDEQVAALSKVREAIDAETFSATLLYGVSGSGKTEVYVRAMQQVVAAGGQAIMLVPEIVLTTQLVGRLAQRFEHVAVNHSGLTDAERSRIWRQVARGEKNVIIGTRSAVFAPCKKLGLICVDEEQESSYKNLQAPRFHVRDVALMRARRLGVPVVLGSATPSIETWFNSGYRSDYQRITISRRVSDLPMPKVHVIDMGDESAETRRTVALSRTLHRMLGETLEAGAQALILLNRRGFAPHLCCPACRTRITCPNCNVGLVAHSATGESVCHYCSRRIPTPRVCPTVGCGANLVQSGRGTQRVEEVLVQLFPSARIARVDSDTMKHQRDYQGIIDDFEQRRVDVLVGTQMIAKGLDFPFVSFVGVIDADPQALSGDFRATERLFQLITQVAGRAGRADASGRVVVQTTDPKIPALQFALNHDYDAFAAHELRQRRAAGLPPFRRLTRVIIADPREERARSEAEAVVLRVREAMGKLDVGDLEVGQSEVFGPNPCMLSRLQGNYRYDLLISTPTPRLMRQLLSELTGKHALNTRAKSLIVDVDPVTLT